MPIGHYPILLISSSVVYPDHRKFSSLKTFLSHTCHSYHMRVLMNNTLVILMSRVLADHVIPPQPLTGAFWSTRLRWLPLLLLAIEADYVKPWGQLQFSGCSWNNWAIAGSTQLNLTPEPNPYPNTNPEKSVVSLRQLNCILAKLCLFLFELFD